MDAIMKSLMDRVLSLLGSGLEKMPVRKSSTLFRSVQTSATGANFATLADEVAYSLVIMNNSGVAIELQKGGSGAVIILNDGFAVKLDYLSNSNDIGIRRQDQSNIQVSLNYILEK